MKKIYMVACGKDRNYYKIDKTFENYDDAERYIEKKKFYTSNDLWIIQIDNYFKNEYKFPEEKYGDPVITAYLYNDKVTKVVISEVESANVKEQRTGNMFKFRLPREENESLEKFLRRGKEVADKKQNEYLSV